MKPEEFGKYLNGLREERKLTTRQVELYAGVSNSYISQLENGKRGIPSAKIMEKLAQVYKVPFLDLMEKAGYYTKEHFYHPDTNEVEELFHPVPQDDPSPKKKPEEVFTPEVLAEYGIGEIELSDYIKKEGLTNKEAIKRLEAAKYFLKKVEN